MHTPRRRIAVTAAVVVALGLIVAGYAAADGRAAAQTFRVRTLVGESDREIGRYAVDYTRLLYRVVSGEPRVVLVRRVTAAELPSLGLGEIGFGGEEPPLALVILRGDFDISAMPGSLDPSLWPSRVAFIAYVFDLRAGMAALTAGSYRGGDLRTALNDPTLPDDLPVMVPQLSNERAFAHPAAPPPTTRRPYGAVAPPAPKPTRP